MIILKDYHESDKALTHVIDDGVPFTNNTIEAFFKITLPRTSKRKFMTYPGDVE